MFDTDYILEDGAATKIASGYFTCMVTTTIRLSCV